MPLPTARDLTLTALSKVPSSLLNNLQDFIIKLWARFELPLPVGPAQMMASADWAMNGEIESMRATAGSPATLWIELPVRVGQIISAVRAFYRHLNNAGATATFELKKVNHTTGTITSKSNATASADNFGARQTVTLTGITPAAVAANERWYVKVVGSATADTRDVFGLELDFQTP